jgi:hypothetical protein
MKTFEQQYPNLTAWIRAYDGWIAIGQDEMSHSLVRVLNPGGLVWESRKTYASIDDALAEADQAVAAELTTY